jgi:hypothetical protein
LPLLLLACSLKSLASILGFYLVPIFIEKY